MTEEEQIYAVLSAYPGLAELVGTRITPLRALQGGDLPCITYQRASGGRDYDHDGIEPMAQSEWQFDAWAHNYDAVRELAAQLRLALDTSESPVAGWFSFLNNETDDYEEDSRFYRVMLLCTCWLRRETA